MALVFCAAFWGERRWASRAFRNSAVAVNCSLPALSIWGPMDVQILGWFIAVFLGCPLILGAGSAWALAATRRELVSGAHRWWPGCRSSC